ncbi:hypothetical protein MNB_SV-12-1357 [hydrothermal vent metagenome]|uniref:Uncharacterized protein n=1 Tax=hydrothermal vent metagenome TaxID=652676 RepID=A0A1W1CKW0_9ZZZZ
MKIEKSKDYERTFKRMIRRHILTKETIEDAVELFVTDSSTPQLHFKKIKCKHDKNRHSIRIPNTQYRILISIDNGVAVLQCICDYDDYNMRNRRC